MSEQATRGLTNGEKLVGITFNPSGDAKVQRAKELCAELADLLIDEFEGREMSRIHQIMLDNTLCQIVNAQMNVVKTLTFKY